MYLSEVPGFAIRSIPTTLVDAAGVIQHVFRPLFRALHKHLVICGNRANSHITHKALIQIILPTNPRYISRYSYTDNL